MKTINCTDWEVITKEGIAESEPPRKKHKRSISPLIKLTLLWVGSFCWMAALIMALRSLY